MQTKREAYEKLKKSKFRSSFRLNQGDIEYIKEKGWETIRSHAGDFVKQKLSPACPLNDGKQTPMKGHPVFKAMHGSAFCCRGCMKKWYKVPEGIPLSEEIQKRIVDFLIFWLKEEMQQYENSTTDGI